MPAIQNERQALMGYAEHPSSARHATVGGFQGTLDQLSFVVQYLSFQGTARERAFACGFLVRVCVRFAVCSGLSKC